MCPQEATVARMTTELYDICEPGDPGVLNQVKKLAHFKDAVRVQESITARAEKRTLIWMAERMPTWVTPDHLTALGFLAQLMAGVSFALAGANKSWLFAVIVCLTMNWFGDSLDGTLARVRQQQRRRYGFYVDHIVDSFGALALMAGMALSGYMHPWIAAGLLVAFLLLSIQSYLATYALGEFRLSFWRFGPTEIRVLLAIGCIALVNHSMVLGGRFRLFDVGGIIAIVSMTLMLIAATVRNMIRLYREERVW
jgi:archaetidylinositol phosphate synthase